jgi:hypothetical protein
MRSGRLYPVAVVLVIGALLGAVSLGRGDLSATESSGSRRENSMPVQSPSMPSTLSHPLMQLPYRISSERTMA